MHPENLRQGVEWAENAAVHSPEGYAKSLEYYRWARAQNAFTIEERREALARRLELLAKWVRRSGRKKGTRFDVMKEARPDA
jgi:hypothetical protein